MRNTIGLLILAAVFAASPSAAADVDQLSDVRITIRLYDSAGLSPADRQLAVFAAIGILEAAGLDVEWRTCQAVFVRAADDPCIAPLGTNELAVRLVTLPPPRNGGANVALGYSLVDTQARGGSLATVYVDRVTGLARTCRMDVRRLLGRTIAHEIGHLLLGTMEHAPAGLMRAIWSAEALRRSDDEDWLFMPGEGRMMRDNVRTRAAERLAMHTLD
jgi:hypothetical protein